MIAFAVIGIMSIFIALNVAGCMISTRSMTAADWQKIYDREARRSYNR